MYGGRLGPAVLAVCMLGGRSCCAYSMTMVGGRVLLYLQYVWWGVGSCCTCSMYGGG